MAAKDIKIVRPGCRCERCGHTWVPMKTNRGMTAWGEGGTNWGNTLVSTGVEIWEDQRRMPRICPKCKSKLWNVPRVPGLSGRTTVR